MTKPLLNVREVLKTSPFVVDFFFFRGLAKAGRLPLFGVGGGKALDTWCLWCLVLGAWVLEVLGFYVRLPFLVWSGTCCFLSKSKRLPSFGVRPACDFLSKSKRLPSFENVKRGEPF